MAGVGHAVVGVGHGADWHLEKELQEGREERTWSQRCGLGPETGVPGPLGWGCSLGPEMGVGPGPLVWGMAWATFLLPVSLLPSWSWQGGASELEGSP